MASHILTNVEREKCANWEMPCVETHEATTTLLRRQLNKMQGEHDAEEKQKLQAEEIYARARQEGLAAASAEINEMRKSLETVIASFDKPMRVLEDNLYEEMMKMVQSLTYYFLEKELNDSPERILEIIKRLVNTIDSQQSSLQVELCPVDYQVVIGLVTEGTLVLSRVKFQSNPQLQRGECRLSDKCVRLNATVHDVLNQIIAEPCAESITMAESIHHDNHT